MFIIIIGKPEFTIEEVMSKKCCEKICFKMLSFIDVKSIRERIDCLSTETQQNQFIIKYLCEHGNVHTPPIYIVSGKEVCEQCWRMCAGLRRKRFQRLKNKFLSGTVYIEHGRQGVIRPSDCTIRAISWMRVFFEKVGDKMPTNSYIHLPSCLTKADVYCLAFDDLTSGGLNCPAPSTFYKIWSKDYSDVVIPKVYNYNKHLS